MANLTHDECNWEYPEELVEFPNIVSKIMEASAAKYCKSVPIPAEATVGDHWIHWYGKYSFVNNVGTYSHCHCFLHWIDGTWKDAVVYVSEKNGEIYVWEYSDFITNFERLSKWKEN